MNTYPGMLLASVRRLWMAAAVATVSLMASGNAAQAQNIDLSTDQVTIDLSVIDDSGLGPATAAPYMARPQGTPFGQGLLLPGRKNPVSRLHVPAPKETVRIKLKKPGTITKEPAKQVAKKAAAKKPTPPAVAAVKPPEPLTAPPLAMPATAPPPPETAPMAVAKAEPKPAPKASPPSAPPPEVTPVKKPVVAKIPEPVIPAAPAIPVASVKPKPKAKKIEQAAVSPAPKSTQPGRALQVVFGATASKLPAAAKDGLKALALKLKGKETLRLQLFAYAGGRDMSSSKARRMSLSRALSVRSFLIENGIRSTRIDVRALGSKTAKKPLNRVDVNIVER